ncbi:MAG: TonB-dependent receptor domain-containing protein [Terriglobia bacterium]
MKNNTRVPFFLLCVLSIALVPNPRVFGQAVTASVVGQVSDSTGAVLPGAKVTLTNQQTGITASAVTNKSGNYEFAYVQPGVYTVSVVLQSFQKSLRTNVDVIVNSTLRVDVKLTVGSVAQTVTVNSEAPVIETDRADVAGVITPVQTAELPVGANRNFQTLESLIPGVSATYKEHSSFMNAQNAQNFTVNGQDELSSNLSIEGVNDNVRSGELSGAYVPPAAAIQTVAVETNNYAPEFGRSTGAVTNVILKSGTNHFHGSLYEYNGVAATSARSYFNNTGTLPGYTDNYWGGTIGGPIRKNRTFFFADFLRSSDHNGLYSLFTIPTEAFDTGDLSASPTAIYDPATGNPNGTGRQQFITNGVANVIPANRIDPISAKLIALLPKPNLPGLTDNWQGDLPFDVDTQSYDGKLNQDVGQNDHLVVRYSYEKVTTYQGPAFGEAGGPGGTSAGFEGTGLDNTWALGIESTHVFSPTLVMETRVGVNHFWNTAQQVDYGTDATTALGIPGINISPFNSGITTIQVTDYSEPLIGYNNGLPWARGETHIDLNNAFTWVKGNHTFKFGWEIQRVRDDLLQGQSPNPRGVYTYDNGQTALNATPSPASGFANAWAAFLLDVPDSAGLAAAVSDLAWRQSQFAGYAQDTWQISPKLTATYGVRYETYEPYKPRAAGGYSDYDPSTNTERLAGIGTVPLDEGMPWNKADFGPRLGIAYRASRRTVVRAGFGTSYDPMAGVGYAHNYPETTSYNYPAPSTFEAALNTSGQAVVFSQGFPPVTPYSIPSSGIIPAPKGQAGTVLNLNYKDPYVMSYSLAVERILRGGWTATVSYVGNLGRHLNTGFGLNDGQVLGAGQAGEPLYIKFGQTAGASLQYGGTNSAYNALQARLDHRFRNGFLWTSSYAWQKATGYESGGVSGPGGLSFNYLPAFRRNYGVLTYNSPQTYSQSLVYDLPFGQKQRFLANSSPVIRDIVGGWKVSDVLFMGVGFPITFTASSTGLNTPGSDQVPDLIAPFKKLGGIGPNHPYFDKSSFATPVGAVFGDMGLNGYSGPALITNNTSLLRDITIHESTYLELRMDAFNSLNHPAFAVPTGSMTSASFGQVTAMSGSYNPRQLQFAATLTF